MAKAKLNIPASRQAALECLSKKERVLFEETVDAYYKRRKGRLRHTEASIQADFAVVYDIIKFTGLAPWNWDEEAFDRWSLNLVEVQRVAYSTQRKYQTAVFSFHDYLVGNVRFQAEVQRLCGHGIVQFIGPKERLRHLIPRELARPRRALTHEEFILAFDALDQEIAMAEACRSKDYWPLCRDKALFFLLYVAGLRIGEAHNMEVDDFIENPLMPEFGKFGMFTAIGKGSRGTGPQCRDIKIDHVDLPPVMGWYLEKVRPKFAVKADPNESAMFLSNWGRRISRRTIEVRFANFMRIARLEDKNFTPHCLRHTSTTHGSLIFTQETVRRKLGHAYPSTTQGYTDIPDNFIEDDICGTVDSLFNSYEEE